MESGERRKPISVLTIILIEVGMAQVMLCAASMLAKYLSNITFAVIFAIVGLILFATVPFTCGLLWNGPRADKYAKLMVRIEGLVLFIFAIGLIIATGQLDGTSIAIPVLAYAFFYIGRAVGWLRERRVLLNRE